LTPQKNAKKCKRNAKKKGATSKEIPLKTLTVALKKASGAFGAGVKTP
jgi:hypothetical protein